MSNFLTNNPFVNGIKNVNAILDPDQKKKAVVMLVLLLINAIIDYAGLATIGTLIFSSLETNAFTAVEYTRSLAESDMQYQVGLGLRKLFVWSGAASEMQFLFYLSIVIFISFVIKNLIGMYIFYIQTRFSFNIALRLNLKMFRYFYDQGYSFIQESTSGKRIYRIVELPSRFASFYMTKLLDFGTELVVLIIIGISLLLIEPLAVVLLALTILPTFGLIYYLTKNQNEKLGNDRNSVAPKNYGNVYESMKAYVDVKLGNLEQEFIDKYKKTQKEINTIDTWVFGIYQKINQRTNDIIFGLGILVIFGYAYFGNIDRTLVITLLGLFAIAAYKFLPSVNRMLTCLLILKNNNYIFEELKIVSGYTLRDFEKVKPLAFDSSIALSDIKYQYKGSNQPTLNHFNLHIEKGDVIGIVGSSGSGKTTLLKLFLRLIKEQSGTLKVDEVLINETNEASFQKIIGYVQQEVFILDTTLIANIALGEENPNVAKVQEVIDMVELTDLVLENKEGLQMLLGEDGKNISGGQKQRVGIARALYKNAQVLVFDEITSALDSETEKNIVRSINNLANLGKTIIVVAHRITTLEKCNKIYRMKNGRISSELSFEKLISESIASA